MNTLFFDPKEYAHIWSGRRYGGKVSIYISLNTEGIFGFTITDIPTEPPIIGNVTIEKEVLDKVNSAKNTLEQKLYFQVVQELTIKAIDTLYIQKNAEELEGIKKYNKSFKVH